MEAGFEQEDLENRKKQLEARRTGLRETRASHEKRAPQLLITGTFLIVLSPILLAVQPNLHLFGIYPAFYGLLFIVGGLIRRQRIRPLTEEITELGIELDLLDLRGLGDDQREFRATKLLQVNQFDLRRYYDQVLRQGSQIFYVGVLCIVLGFVVVGVSFWLVQSSQLHSLSEKIVVASLGAIGGMLANFIAVIYLQMFSKTIESVGTFHRRLALRDRLNFGNILAAKIDAKDIRDETLREMAIELSNVLEPSPPPATAAHNGRPAQFASPVD